MYLDELIEDFGKKLALLSPYYWIAFAVAFIVLIVPTFRKKRETLSPLYFFFPLIPYYISSFCFLLTNEVEEPVRFVSGLMMGTLTSYLVLGIITFFLGIPVYLVYWIKDRIKKEPYFDWDRIFYLFTTSKFAFFYLAIILSIILLFHFPQQVRQFYFGGYTGR